MNSEDPKKEPDILCYPHPKFWHYIESGDGDVFRLMIKWLKA